MTTISERRPDMGARRQLSEEVESYIRNELLSGGFKTGEYLRVETLASQIGISPTPIREALQVLRTQGFFELVPRRGFRVLELRRSDIEDINLTQTFLAGELARRAATRLTDEQIAELSEIDEALTRASVTKDGATYQRLNREFHRIINRSADAPKLTMLLKVVLFYIPQKFFETTGIYPPPDDRRDLLAAIGARDPERTESAMRELITRSGERYEGYLDEQGLLGPQ